MNREFETKREEAKQITELQGSTGNWNFDPYMHGMYNGMEMIMSIFEEREPQFKEAPEEWLFDKNCEPQETCSEDNLNLPRKG